MALAVFALDRDFLGRVSVYPTDPRDGPCEAEFLMGLDSDSPFLLAQALLEGCTLEQLRELQLVGLRKIQGRVSEQRITPNAKGEAKRD